MNFVLCETSLKTSLQSTERQSGYNTSRRSEERIDTAHLTARRKTPSSLHYPQIRAEQLGERHGLLSQQSPPIYHGARYFPQQYMENFCEIALS